MGLSCIFTGIEYILGIVQTGGSCRSGKMPSFPEDTMKREAEFKGTLS